MEQLNEGVGLRQIRGELLEHGAVIGLHLPGSLDDGANLTQQVGDRAKITRSQQVGEEVLQNGPHFGRRVGVELEDVEEYRQHVAAQILFVLASDLALEVCDFFVVEEVQRRVVVLQVHDPRRTLGLGRVLGYLLPDVVRGDRLPGVRLLDGWHVHAGHVDGDVAHVLEIFSPKDGQQVVLGVGGQIASFVDPRQQPHDLVVLDPREQADGPYPILEQLPRYAVALVFFGEDLVAIPLEAALLDLEDQWARHVPHGLERLPCGLHRLVIHGMVRAVERDRPKTLFEAQHQDLNDRRIELQLRCHTVRHSPPNRKE